jgi:hypothetical protein
MITETFFESFSDRFVIFWGDFSDNCPNKMNVTHLPGRARKHSCGGGLDPGMTVRDNEIHFGESPVLQIGKYPFPGKFMFSVSYTSSEGPPLSVFPYPDDYEKSFVDVLDSISYFEIRCINEKIQNVGIDGSFHKLRYFRIKFLCYLRDVGRQNPGDALV